MLAMAPVFWFLHMYNMKTELGTYHISVRLLHHYRIIIIPHTAEVTQSPPYQIQIMESYPWAPTNFQIDQMYIVVAYE